MPLFGIVYKIENEAPEAKYCLVRAATLAAVHTFVQNIELTIPDFRLIKVEQEPEDEDPH